MANVGTAIQKANINDAVQGGWISWHQLNYDPASLAAAAQRAEDITVANAKVGDLVFAQLETPSAMIAITGAKVTSAGVVTVYLQNLFDATTAVDLPAINVNIIVLHKT